MTLGEQSVMHQGGLWVLHYRAALDDDFKGAVRDARRERLVMHYRAAPDDDLRATVSDAPGGALADELRGARVDSGDVQYRSTGQSLLTLCDVSHDSTGGCT
ncbi:hypothetical protein NDU88_008466 [Pleurodeles waltl]|uniref:Uncharacterized protein n=1 Tax=Pleurodeles waltl TaxID=8319 RepID=A0AAV7NZ16_PLEWA|nr:hypothetical protein NDU88_008466 [Pleurodeles waltl]